MNDFIPDIDICLKAEEEQIDYKEYVLTKDKVKYTIKIGKTKSKIIIDCIHYEYKSNLEELIQISKLFNICKTIEEVYEFIINLFNKKKVSIKEIIPNKSLKLFFIIYNNIKSSEEKVEIILFYNKYNKHIIINEMYNKYNIMQKEFNEVKEENKKIKDQIKQIMEEISTLKKENSDLKNEIHNLRSVPAIPLPKNVSEKEKENKKVNSNKKLSKSK